MREIPNRQNLVLVAAPAVLIAASSFAVFAPPIAVVSCLLGWSMLAIAVNDARDFIIPDTLSLPAIPVGLLVSRVIGSGASPGSDALLAHVAAAALGAGALYGVREAYRWWRGREGLGLGDVKLAAAAGAWTGIQGLGHVLLLACALAFAFVLLVNARDMRTVRGSTAIPLGVFLAPSIWIVWCANSLMPAAPAPGL